MTQFTLGDVANEIQNIVRGVPQANALQYAVRALVTVLEIFPDARISGTAEKKSINLLDNIREYDLGSNLIQVHEVFKVVSGTPTRLTPYGIHTLMGKTVGTLPWRYATKAAVDNIDSYAVIGGANTDSPLTIVLNVAPNATAHTLEVWGSSAPATLDATTKLPMAIPEPSLFVAIGAYRAATTFAPEQAAMRAQLMQAEIQYRQSILTTINMSVGEDAGNNVRSRK